MQVDAAAPSTSAKSDDVVTITIATPTPPEPVNVAEATPEAQITADNVHDSGAPLQPDAPSVDSSSPSRPTFDLASNDSARSATPTLSQGMSEPEEMEVEPLEIHTPPPTMRAPIVAVDDELVSKLLTSEQKEPALGTTDASREEAV
uniref:14-alpha sterol demethylase Cyp51B (EC) n=1 Tax=Ganoderma boninense TaxID=34458 RepID=A0A5K1JU95_9APHY|nr:14-alpha sterol demethylase Cyp51B (EC [Ganoderma boninense]